MTFKVGELYEIVFEDHCHGHDTPFIIGAYGVVLSDHDTYVRLSSWIVHTTDLEVFNGNLEKFVVLKSCIKSRKKLCRTKMK